SGETKMPYQPRALLLGMAVTLMPTWAFAGDTKKPVVDAKKPSTKVLLFLNVSGQSLQMTSAEPIRRVLDAGGKVILDLDPTKAGGDGSLKLKMEYKKSRFVGAYWSSPEKRTWVSVSCHARGTAAITLEGG